MAEFGQFLDVDSACARVGSFDAERSARISLESQGQWHGGADGGGPGDVCNGAGFIEGSVLLGDACDVASISLMMGRDRLKGADSLGLIKGYIVTIKLQLAAIAYLTQ